MERTILTIVIAIIVIAGGMFGINSWINSKAQEKIDRYEEQIKDMSRELDSKTSEINYRIIPQVTERITETRVIQEGNKRVVDDVILSNMQLTNGFVHSYNQIILGEPIDITKAQDTTISAFNTTDILVNSIENSKTRLENEANHNALIDWIVQNHEAQKEVNNR